ncbi:MAG: indole-3-glycerol-phosphate synthase [bacterium]|nr:indole-3-glycerol-phosphate synthase [bacterium]
MDTENPASLGWEFRRALSGEGLSIIAELKRRSPSRGDLRPEADAAEVARSYRDGGAACLSVLTDSARFGGSPDDLRRARDASGLPVLRKDFLTTPQHVRDSADMGAAAMLVIVEDVGAEAARSLQERALTLRIDVLTEVRTEGELEQAVEAGAYMIAVNQRDDPKQSRPTVDFGKAERIAEMFDQLDDGIVTVAASGIGVPGGTPIGVIADAGYDAALIGEALVTAPDPAAALAELIDSLSGRRSGPASQQERPHRLAAV